MMGLLVLSACARVTVKDEVFCADMGSQGAHCDNFLTQNPVDIQKSDWDDMRFGQFCISADALGDLKTEIESLCSVSNDCDYQTQKQITQFFAKLNHMKAMLK